MTSGAKKKKKKRKTQNNFFKPPVEDEELPNFGSTIKGDTIGRGGGDIFKEPPKLKKLRPRTGKKKNG